MRWRCTIMPVSATTSAFAQRSKSMGSTFSSTSVMRCGSGVSAAISGKAATGILARLPSKGSACSSPQKEISNLGLMRTMSAIDPPLNYSNGLQRRAPSLRSAEQGIEVEQLFMLVEGIAIGHAGDEVAHLTGEAATVVSEGVFAPAGRHELRIVHIGLE